MLKTLHRAAIKLVTGLPHYTWLSVLHDLSAFNTFTERAEARVEAQRARLTTYTTGTSRL